MTRTVAVDRVRLVWKLEPSELDLDYAPVCASAHEAKICWKHDESRDGEEQLKVLNVGRFTRLALKVVIGDCEQGPDPAANYCYPVTEIERKLVVKDIARFGLI